MGISGPRDIYKKHLISLRTMGIKSIVEMNLREAGVVEPLLERPKDLSMGDFAFPCFSYAKYRGKDPVVVSGQLVEKLVGALAKEGIVVEQNGPYVNFKVVPCHLAAQVLPTFISNVPEKTRREGNEEIVVEYFQGNTHKGVHIGHIRNLSMGEALCRILERAGNRVRRVNFQGDIGPHVAKCLWGLRHLAEKPPAHHRGIWLGKIYAQSSQKIKENPSAAEEIKDITIRLYEKDSTWIKLWKETRQWCLDDFEVLYKEFGVRFDRLYFESDTEELGRDMVHEMLKDGIAQKSQGATIIDLTEHKLGIYVLLTAEGYALYSAKDIGLAYLKLKEFPNMSRSINVVGSEQNLHFQQLYKTLEIMGYPIADRLFHFSYGLVMLPEGKMSSRDGTLVLYHDLMERMLHATLKEVKSRHVDWGEQKQKSTAKSIALAAIKFWMISREPQKNVVFDWETATDLEGETGPYIQYAAVRASSVLRQSGKDPAAFVPGYQFGHPKEKKLLQILSLYVDCIGESAKKYRPHMVSGYLMGLAQAFNEFYHECPVIKSEPEVSQARLALTKVVRNVLADGLGLLGIDVLDAM